MKCIIGKDNIAQQVPELLYDESRFTSGIPRKACFPSAPEEIRTVVREAHANRIPLAIIGGKTGITGACVPVDDCIALCLSNMATIRGVRRLSDGSPMLLCDPGISLEAIARFCDAPDQWPAQISGKEALRTSPWFYPPDPTEMTAQLGGTVATNASGARSLRFGPTRLYIEEISVVLANGDTATIRRGANKEMNNGFKLVTDQGNTIAVRKPAYRFPAIKNVSGYYSGKDMDIIDLFIGSEGTLAIFSEIGIRLVRKRRFIGGLSFFPDRKNAFAAASFLRQMRQVAALEYFDASALRILDVCRDSMSLDLPQFPSGSDAAVYWEFLENETDLFENHMDSWETMFVRHGSSFENTWSGFESGEMEKLKAFRHAVPEAVNNAIALYKRDCPDIRKISTDAAVPAEVFERTMDEWFDKIQRSGLEHAVFGHLGDFHLHFNLIPHNETEFATAKQFYDEMMQSAIAANGTVSAEHGIGKLKKPYLRMMYGESAIREMMEIKASLDPFWLLNRGNLFDPPTDLPL
jgi:D-lactate dehydrogenase (cytochrome)